MLVDWLVGLVLGGDWLGWMLSIALSHANHTHSSSAPLPSFSPPTVAILSELLKKPLVPFFHVLCGVNLDGSLDVVEGVQEKLAGVVSYHTQTGTWNHPNMVPPAGGGFHENHFISVVVAAEQVGRRRRDLVWWLGNESWRPESVKKGARSLSASSLFM